MKKRYDRFETIARLELYKVQLEQEGSVTISPALCRAEEIMHINALIYADSLDRIYS